MGRQPLGHQHGRGQLEQLVVHVCVALARNSVLIFLAGFHTPPRGARVMAWRPCWVPVPLQPKLLAEHEPSVLIQTFIPLSTHPSCNRCRGTTRVKDGVHLWVNPGPKLGPVV